MTIKIESKAKQLFNSEKNMLYFLVKSSVNLEARQ